MPLLAGCGADTEDTASTPATAAPTIAQTAPVPSATVAPKAKAPKTTTAPAPEPTPAAPSPAPNACETSKAISRLTFKGVACDEAAVIADAWDQDQDRCSTIDDPNSPEGYSRTCTVEDYTCKAKRDVKSDARFVACARGGAQIRFTWAPP